MGRTRKRNGETELRTPNGWRTREQGQRRGRTDTVGAMSTYIVADPKPYYLYEVTHNTRCVYVGATRCPQSRPQTSMRRVGGDAWRLLVAGTREYVLDLERKLITIRRSAGCPLVNRHGGGQWSPGAPGNRNASHPMSEEHKEKIRRGNRGKKRTPEQRRRMSAGIARGWVARRAAGHIGWTDEKRAAARARLQGRARRQDGKLI